MAFIVNISAPSSGLDWKLDHRQLARLDKRGISMRNQPAFVRLTEYFNKRPALKAVNELAGTGADNAAALLAFAIANKDFSVIGTNMTTALCTFAANGGINLRTAGADGDQAILLPSLSTGITPWSAGSWLSQNQVRFESIIRTGGRPLAITNSVLTTNVVTITTSTPHDLSVGQSVTVALLTGGAGFAALNGTYVVASIPSTTTFTYALVNANVATTASTGTVTTNNLKFQTIWTGLKLTNTDAIATDAEAFYARYLPTENNGNWQIITARAGVKVTTVLPIPVTPNTVYRMRFNIDATRNPSVEINGVNYDLTVGNNGQSGATGNAPLTSGISFIPYTGTSANGSAATKAIDVLPGYDIQAAA